MISNSEHYASTADGGEGIPVPSPQDQDLILDAWHEALAQVLASRDTEWQQHLRAMKAESTAAIAELRVNAAEFRSTMDAMLEKRLAQIREPADGPRGEQGERGKDGMLPVARLWQPDVVHYEGTVVAFDGATFQALKDTGRDPRTDDWICLATGGRDGRDGTEGRSLRVRGTYRLSEDYAALDVVALNGGSFIARRDDPGECPGDGWQAQSLPGKRGDRGPKGEQGEKGEHGERGPGIVGWDIDRDNYTVSAVLSDQTRSEPLDLRGLFEQYLLERINVDG